MRSKSLPNCPKVLSSIFFFFIIVSLAGAQTTGGGQSTVSKPTDTMAQVMVLLLLPGQENTGQAADGAGVYYSNIFSNDLGDEDSYKFTNPDENLGIVRNGKMLSIEGRKVITDADTLPLKVWKLCQLQYKLKIKVSNFANNVHLFLQDNYLQTTTSLNNNAEALLSFSIGTNPASVAPDRFRIVMTSYATLPVQLSGLKAYEKNKGIEVAWSSENESNIDRYEVEQSFNAQSFYTVGRVAPKNIAGVSSHYTWFNETQNSVTRYFRIKSTDKSGEIKFSPVVKVQPGTSTNTISIAGNVGGSNAVTMFFKNAAKGSYELSVINIAGQKFFNGKVSHAGGTSTQVVSLNKSLTPGIYRLLVMNDGKQQNLPFLVN